MERKPFFPIQGTRAGCGCANQDGADSALVLNERMKELDCLHGIGRLVTAPLSVEEVLIKAAALIAGSMQHPEKSAVRLSSDDKTYISGNFSDQAILMSSPICMNGEQSGKIEVSYPAGPEDDSRYTFLPEEEELINTIAGTLGRFLEYRFSMEVLGRNENLLEEIGRIAKIGGWEYDPHDGSKRWTDEIVRIHDLKSATEAEIEKGYHDYTSSSRELFEEVMKSSFRSGRPFSIECELVTRKGLHKWVRVIGKPVESDGRVVKMRGTVQDITESKMASQEIVKSREYLSATLDSIGDAVIVTDIDGIITMINPAAESITGWKSREASGQPVETVFRVIKENTGREINSLISKIWKGDGSDIPGNLMLISKEGQKTPVAANSTPLKDRAGSLTGVVLIFRDRSEEWLFRKIQDTRVRLFEFSVSHTLNDLLVRIIDEAEDITGSNIGFYHFIPDEGGSVSLKVWSTRTCEKHCGLAAESHHYDISETGIWTDCISAMEPVIYNDYNSLAHKKGYPEEHAVLSRLMTVPVVRNNRVVAIIGVGNKPAGYTARDAEILMFIADRTWEIAEKMHSEEEFKSKERQLRLLRRSVEQSPLSLFITDTEGRIEYVNSTFLRWSGYTFDEVTGKTLRILKPGNIPDSMHREIWKNLSDGGDWHGEHLNMRKNGETYWEKVHLSSVRNKEGITENFIALCGDITRQKEIESNLIAAKERAEESDRLKSAFLANMSHEIRTPMNGILGFLQLLRRPEISDTNKDQYISIVTESGNRLMNTINDLIEVSQIEVGQIHILFSAVDLKEMMDYLYGFFKPEAEKKGLELKKCYNLPDPMGVIYTDKNKILSVLTNLIKNALKFTNEGFVEFGAGFSGKNLCLYVRDSGIGIQEDKHDSIFERFVQADMEYSKGYEGSGLGLSIAKSYIEALGGTISIKSQVGEGAIFWVSLAYNPAENSDGQDKDRTWPACPCQSGEGLPGCELPES